jgi:hypothetical protein
MLWNAPSQLSRNTLWPGSPQLTPPSQCPCVKDSCHKRKSLKISCGPLVCIHSSLPPRTTMGSWITTRQILLHQNAKSSYTRKQVSDKLGPLAGSMDTHLVPPCIITGFKMYTYRQRPATTSWTLSNYFPTTIKFHSYHPLTGY